jgi:hypothetical protein
MIEFLAGAALTYAIGVVQVYRERKEFFARHSIDADPLMIALQWPLAAGPKW